MVDAGLGNSILAAMGQSFFTLSIGIGALAIFGSYIGKELPSDRRSPQYHHSGYTGCIYGWSDHFPGMFCIWS